MGHGVAGLWFAIRRSLFFMFGGVAIAIIASRAQGICVPSVYSRSGTPPPTFNWTDTTAWTPSGGFPGCAPGDAVQVVPASPTTIVVNSAIPNPIIGLNLNCAGCVIDIQPGGALTIAGGASIGSGSTLKVSGGTLTIANIGILTMQTGSQLDVSSGLVDVNTGGQLDLQSSATISAGTLQMSGGTLTTSSGSSLSLTTASAQLSLLSGSMDGSGSIDNVSGSVLVNSGSTFTISSAFNVGAGASVQVSSGTFSLTGGGTGDGPFVIDGGAVMDFPSGSYVLTPDGVVSGDGTLAVTGGTLSIGGVTRPGHYSMSAGTLTGDGFLTVPGDFRWSGGTITGTGGAQIEGTGHGYFTGDDGPMALDGRNFDHYGYLEYTATTNSLTVGNGAVFADYGSFDITVDGTLACDCTVPPVLRIAPNGSLSRYNSAGIFSIGVPTENKSSIGVYSGTLRFTNDGTHNGAFFGASGATVEFAGPSTTIAGYVGTDGSVYFSGSTADVTSFFDVHETTKIEGATVTIHGTATTKDLELPGGTLDVDDFHMTGHGTWSSGTITGTKFTVDGSGVLDIDAANGPVTLGCTLQNDGTINYAPDDGVLVEKRIVPNGALGGGNLELEDGSSIENNGLFDLQNDAPITIASIVVGNSVPRRRPVTHAASTGPTVYNHATLQKSGASGTTDFEPALINDGTVSLLSGTLNLMTSYQQTAGSTVLGGGDLKSTNSAFTMDGGSLTGGGTVTGDVLNNAGSVEPGTPATAGTININGDYTQGSSASMTVKLGGTTPGASDQINVAVAATLDGAFTATLLSFTPADGDTFDPLTFATRTGAFATESLPSFDPPYGSFSSAYLPTAFELTAAVTPHADLSITKSGPNGVTAGQNIAYTISVTNNGPFAAANVIVSDPTPANTTFLSNSGDCTGPFPCNLGTLAPSQTKTITSTFSTSPSFSGNVSNTATVSSTTPDTDGSNNSSTKTTNVGAQADLSVTKTGPPSITPGQDIVYTVVVTNLGPSPATSVVVSDPTPVGLAFQSNTNGCATPYPCAIGTLNAGQSATIVSTYTVPANYAAPSIVNIATGTSAVNDPDNSNDSSAVTTTIVAQADVAVTKTGPASVAPGQLISYTINVSNAGPSSATGIVVSDSTPPGLTFLSNSGACTTPFPCNVGNLASGASASITATYSVPANYASTSITNTASITSTTSDPISANDSSTVTTPVVAQSDVSITKTGPASFVAGQDVVYTITITNLGPLVANNVFASDPTPAGLTFVSNAGACTSSYPCGPLTLAVNETAVITTTFHVPDDYPGLSITNTASVSSSTLDISTPNNTSTVVTPRASGAVADLSITKAGPAGVSSGVVDFTITVRNNGPLVAAGVVISDPTPTGLSFYGTSGACSGSFPCAVGSLAPSESAVVHARYFVTAAPGTTITNTASVTSAATDPQPANDSSSASLSVNAPVVCPATAPLLVAPANGAILGSPVVLSWSTVQDATEYVVTISGPNGPQTTHVQGNTTTVNLSAGAYSWNVSAASGDCPQKTSAAGSFVVCNANLPAPAARAISETTTGQTFEISWDPIDGADSYELQQSFDDSFDDAQTFEETATRKAFTKSVPGATPFFYRVRALSSCGLTGPYSPPVRVAVVPVPTPDATNINVNVPDGSTTPVTFQIHIPGVPGGSTSFIATVDKPWLSVAPTSGIVPPDGMLLTISTDPTSLVNGTWTGTVIVVYGTVSVARSPRTNGGPPPYIVPVSISLVTPVTPTGFTSPAASALVIPAVGHLAGIDSTWRSDVRIANTAQIAQKYKLSFNAGTGSVADLMKTANITVDAGSTTALDDVVRKWFGAGSLGESSNGALVIEPLDADGKVSAVLSKTTAVSSRTFNASSTGTLGQFIPGLAFASFISNTAGKSLLSLQQLSQSADYRTNLGILEASGKPASVLVSAFNELGQKLLEVPLTLGGGEQKQLNAFLASRGISAANARIEVGITGGEGRIASYASVVDSRTGDPFLVFGAPTGMLANHFVVPGVADLQGGSASWRSDVRLFNSGSQPEVATLTFFPTGDPSHSLSQTTTINSGEVRALDGVLQSLFGVTNTGGALHVTTLNDSPLVVTARTYDQRPGGTVGQFVPAVTPIEASGVGDKALQILQTEESARYRTNLGIAEVTGHSAVVEIAVHLPDSKITPLVQVTLAPNEFRQLPVLGSLNLGALYNTRISVRVVDGEGRVTAYGSVIDKSTGDPTYIPAQ